MNIGDLVRVNIGEGKVARLKKHRDDKEFNFVRHDDIGLIIDEKDNYFRLVIDGKIGYIYYTHLRPLE